MATTLVAIWGSSTSYPWALSVKPSGPTSRHWQCLFCAKASDGCIPRYYGTIQRQSIHAFQARTTEASVAGTAVPTGWSPSRGHVSGDEQCHFAKIDRSTARPLVQSSNRTTLSDLPASGPKHQPKTSLSCPRVELVQACVGSCETDYADPGTRRIA